MLRFLQKGQWLVPNRHRAPRRTETRFATPRAARSALSLQKRRSRPTLYASTAGPARLTRRPDAADEPATPAITHNDVRQNSEPVRPSTLPHRSKVCAHCSGDLSHPPFTFPTTADRKEKPSGHHCAVIALSISSRKQSKRGERICASDVAATKSFEGQDIVLHGWPA
jgi:hypothetical protein